VRAETSAHANAERLDDATRGGGGLDVLDLFNGHAAGAGAVAAVAVAAGLGVGLLLLLLLVLLLLLLGWRGLRSAVGVRGLVGGGTVVVGAAAGPGVSVIFDPGGRRLRISALIFGGGGSKCDSRAAISCLICVSLVCDMPAATARSDLLSDLHLPGCSVGAGAASAVAEAAASAVAVAAGLGGEAAGWRGFRFDVWVGMRNALAAGWGGCSRTQAQEMFWITLWNHTVLRIVAMCVSKCDSRQWSRTLS
jgi:hypothetical protein